MLKITAKNVSFHSNLDSEFNEFIGREMTQQRERIRSFLSGQCDQMDKLLALAAKGDRSAMEKLLLKEKSRSQFLVAVRVGRFELEKAFGSIGL